MFSYGWLHNIVCKKDVHHIICTFDWGLENWDVETKCKMCPQLFMSLTGALQRNDHNSHCASCPSTSYGFMRGLCKWLELHACALLNHLNHGAVLNVLMEILKSIFFIHCSCTNVIVINVQNDTFNSMRYLYVIIDSV